MPAQIRVLLLDDDLRTRTAVRLLIAQTEDLQLVGETANVAEIIELCSQTVPHILLLGGVKRH